MNGISMPAEPVYRTCWAYNSSTKQMEHKTYNYTEMLERVKSSTPPEGITYWVPDEYGRVYIDPNHPMQAVIESDEPLDCSDIRLPAPGSAALPAGSGRKERTKKEEEQKLQEERERVARQEALLHRLSMAILSANR